LKRPLPKVLVENIKREFTVSVIIIMYKWPNKRPRLSCEVSKSYLLSFFFFFLSCTHRFKLNLGLATIT
jgi:hypothetical protein